MNTIKLLVVDDNPGDILLLKKTVEKIERLSIHLVSQVSFGKGCEYLSKNPVDIILLDLNLPDGQGPQMIKPIFSINPTVPIVVFTGMQDESLAEQALQLGAQDYLEKGNVDEKLLERVIRYAIGRQEAQNRLREANKKLEEMIHIDPLTEVLNRRGLEQILFRETKRAHRLDNHLIAILVDIDNFKSINDNLGHSVGDLLLKRIAQLFRKHLRVHDYVGRIGGDEFMLILPDTNLGEGMRVAEKLRIILHKNPIVALGEPVKATASFGVERINSDSFSLDELLNLTESALHESKKRGKDCVSSTQEQQPKKEGGGDEGNEILSNLVVYQQPIYRLMDEQIVAYELLSRLKLPNRAMPDEFFREAFHERILFAVDYQCLRNCLHAAQTMDRKYLCHVNIFPSTLLSLSVERLQDILKEGCFTNICFEVSEQEIIGDPFYLQEAVKKLKQSGIQIAIDDIGYGNSNLESIIVLEPEWIKIDKGIVRDCHKIPRNYDLLRKISEIANVLKVKMIVEGIEQKQELQKVKELGIEYAQGFLWSKPVPCVPKSS